MAANATNFSNSHMNTDKKNPSNINNTSDKTLHGIIQLVYHFNVPRRTVRRKKLASKFFW